MSSVKLTPGTKGVVIIEVGDADKDGKVGVRIRGLADIPLDGTDVPLEILSIPEIEPSDVAGLATTVGEAVANLAPMIGGLVSVISGGRFKIPSLWR